MPRRPRISCPLLRQGWRFQGLDKGLVYSPQVGNSLGKTPVSVQARLARAAGGRGFGPVAAVVAGLPVEDTSGSASPALLRGRTGRATLGPGCPRERHPVWPADPSLPGAGPVRWDRRGAGVSSQRGDGLATRGVRADRVGVIPAHQRSRGRNGSRRTGLRPRPDLTRETSADGGRRRDRASVSSLRRAASPLLGAGGSGGQRSCSWIDLVAEVDERRKVQAEGPWV